MSRYRVMVVVEERNEHEDQIIAEWPLDNEFDSAPEAVTQGQRARKAAQRALNAVLLPTKKRS